MRVLFLSDSHLGFDLPTRARIKRRRRGHDFLANHELALNRALRGDIDLVIHGGDVFHRPRVVASLVHQAFAAMKRVADQGIPVVIVPGNHERSRIPHVHVARHPGIHIFDRPRTFGLRVDGMRVAVSGFPYARNVRATFAGSVHATDWRAQAADIRLLCLHHCVEGATVGPSDFTFRDDPDVIRGRDIPDDFTAVLSGHIHRHQTLRRDLGGRPLGAPVFYAGSVERTSVAEIDEAKGYLVMDMDSRGGRGVIRNWRFVSLPARPMIVASLQGDQIPTTRASLNAWLDRTIGAAPEDAVLRLRIQGSLPESLVPLLSAPRVRERAPSSMNIDVSLQMYAGSLRTRDRSSRNTSQAPPEQLGLMI